MAATPMELLPYVERMGAAAGVIFFLLYLRAEYKRDAITKQLIDLLPVVMVAMGSTKTTLDNLTSTIREGAIRDAARTKD